MKKLILCAVITGISRVTCIAQDMPRVHKTITDLCSPEMHGRGYVENGDKIAADYIRNRFIKNGLKGFTTDYYQKFTLPVNTFPDDVELTAGHTKLQPGIDFILDAASAGKEGKGKAVYLDTLIFTNEKAGMRFLKKDLSKKVLVLSKNDFDRLLILPAAFKEKVTQAKAVISLEKKLTATVSKTQHQQPVFEVLETSWPATTQKIKFEVEAEFKEAYQTQNVIAYIEGSHYPDSFLVFSAHYDHLGRQGKDIYFPGANDNASGTAMLLELADYYSKPENKPAFSVAFMAFGAEEAGLIGSKYYTQNPLFPLQQISFLLNLDLLGTGDDGMMVVNGKVFQHEFKVLEKINTEKKLLPEIRSRGKAANSDHYPFTEKGVKAFFFYTLGGTTAYHDVLDVPATLPLTKFKEVFSLITAFSAIQMHPYK